MLLVIGGSACISVSAMFVKLSGVGAGTAAFLRCLMALIALVPLAVFEVRRRGWRPRRLVAYDLAAGLLLGIDFVFWAAAIRDVGASITTVLLNVQVIVFPVLARVFTGAPLATRFYVTAPVLLGGVALASGAIGESEPGSSPVTGVLYGSAAGVAFAGYLLLTREGGRTKPDDAPSSGGGHIAVPVATASASAAVSSGIFGALWTGIDLTPGAAAFGWLGLTTLFGQVLALLLITPALPRLAPATGAALLLLQPVGAIAAGLIFLDERPTVTQYAGCALVLVSVWLAARGPAAAAADRPVARTRAVTRERQEH